MGSHVRTTTVEPDIALPSGIAISVQFSMPMIGMAWFAELKPRNVLWGSANCRDEKASREDM